MKNPAYDLLLKCLDCVRKKTSIVPKVAVILGSGLGDYADTVNVTDKISYADIDGFPVSTVPGHNGQFLFGTLSGTPAVIMQGRVHYYEGYPMDEVVLPVRLMGLMGAEFLILTNAVGAVNSNFEPGGFMAINDQIGSFVPSPLRGANIDELGQRFPDMSCIYNKELLSCIHSAADSLKIKVYDGVYLQAPGPNYETPAEIRMYKAMGADVVGMSTACEAIAANHMGLKVCGISCISNMASGISEKPLSHEDVQKVANESAPIFKKLLTRTVVEISKLN